MRRQLPTDLSGKPMTFKQERHAARSYRPDRKAWHFPIKEAFDRLEKRKSSR